MVDLTLPFLDERIPSSLGRYEHQHAKRWAEKIESFGAYVFATPEYNHSTSGALKNAIDFLYREWNNKAAGFVSYGSAGGARALEHLRLIMAEHGRACPSTVDALVAQRLREVHDVHARPPAERKLHAMFDRLLAWGAALKAVRTRHAQDPAA